ncbi:hypothetical protein F4782DRAFT_509951 [Xylaria castorea]|nr:hypothetical protein F4782DRAFT_509951 [Xylaria castorea]
MPLRPSPIVRSRFKFLRKSSNNLDLRQKLWDNTPQVHASDELRRMALMRPNPVSDAEDNAIRNKWLRMCRKESNALLRSSYTRDLIDRTRSVLGMFRAVLIKMQTPLRRWSRNRGTIPRLGFTGSGKWPAQVTKYGRRIVQCRVWFLDLHSMENMEFIINGLDQKELRHQLLQARGKVKAITAVRHAAETVKERKQLFAIANALRRLEAQEVGPPRFPSSKLRTVERNLFQAEVLCLELIVRKALINGPRVHRVVIRTLRKLGYDIVASDFPIVDPDDGTLDEEDDFSDLDFD